MSKRIYKRSELKKLFNKLNSVCSILNNDFEINCGGCCYVAACIAKELDTLKIPYSLAIFPDRDICCTNNYIRENIISRNNNCIGLGDNVMSHYAIKLSHIGVINRSGFEDYLLIRNIHSKDIFFIYKSGSWNITYNDSNNTKVSEEIAKVFSAINI